MLYNHHRKAGNEGDCVKHPALIAGLDALLQNHQTNTSTLFHYLDIFAGHAWHPLLDGDEYEWRNGIGRVTLDKKAPDSVKCWWHMWHDAPKWPTPLPSGYPGSSWIAAHRCRMANRPVKLELYDHSEEVRRDLERAFPASHAIQETSPNICLIGQSLDPTKVKQEHINQADLVFIDPPGWQPTLPLYPKWTDILTHVLKPRGDKNRPTLMWMPSAGNNGVFNGKLNRKAKDVAKLNYHWSAVRWQTHGSGTACMLVYNFAVDAIQKAIGCIVDIAGSGWEKRHSHKIRP